MANNKQVVCIEGTSGAGKSTSLEGFVERGLDKGLYYLNCEAGKEIPFNNNFKVAHITDPFDVFDAFDEANEDENCHTIVLDTVTFLMDMYESIHVTNSGDTFTGWRMYKDYWAALMHNYIATTQLNVIILAHVETITTEEGVVEVKIPIKGSLRTKGLEAWFTSVISAKTIPIKKLSNYKNDMLNVTEEEKMLGFKHVFQTKLTKDTLTEKIKTPRKMFTEQETFIDNDAFAVLKHISEFYND